MMARLELNGLDEFAFDFNELANMPDEVIEKMVIAEGDVIKEAQSFYAAKMLQGPYYEGGVVAGVKRGKVKRIYDGKALYVTFEGEQHGNRLAEIAFVNEFGKGHGIRIKKSKKGEGKKGYNHQVPRQFIRTANEECADAAVDAAEKIYDEYLSSLGF